MKKFFKLALFGVASMVSVTIVSCSDDKDEPDHKEPGETYVTQTVGFKNVPANLVASDAYGTNLYYGGQNQITTGYLAPIDEDVYAQFSINYGETYDAAYNTVWGYSYFQGGLAVSKYHDMTDDTYLNQLSVYSETSPSGGNFVVAFGYATNDDNTQISNPSTATLKDYSGCGRVYITDAKGYSVMNPGVENSFVTGEDEDAFFESVSLNNTTYTYLAMKNGNQYAAALNEENKGWLKVQFIAFDDNEPDTKPSGWVEAYLANFDKSLAGGYMGIIDEWIEVDLSSLPECSILVINFVGSDVSEYGLNTPTYCALDNFKISVGK